MITTHKALGISALTMIALTVASPASANVGVGADLGVKANVNLGQALKSEVKGSFSQGTTSRGWDKDNDGERDNGKDKKDHTSSSSVIQGNGQPVIAGTVTAVSGGTVTVTTKNGIVYSVNTLTSNVYVGKDATTTSALKIGGTVVVQGTVNGNSVVASSIVQEKNNGRFGFFRGFGLWFRSLFGF